MVLNIAQIILFWFAFGCTHQYTDQNEDCTKIGDFSVYFTGYMGAYYSKYQEYPEDIIDFIEKMPNLGYHPAEIDTFIKFYKDPFTKYKDGYRYYPIKQNGINLDYVVYSIGPDKRDSNGLEIEKYNNMQIDTLYFYEVSCLDDNIKKAVGDVIVEGFTTNPSNIVIKRK